MKTPLIGDLPFHLALKWLLQSINIILRRYDPEGKNQEVKGIRKALRILQKEYPQRE